MNWRLIALVLGCTAAGAASAGIASHHFGQDLFGQHARQPIPLFVASAQQTDPRPSWPPPGAVAFNDETIALLTLAATASRPATEEAEPPRPMTRQERRGAQQEESARLRAERAQARDEARGARAQARETIEIHVRDSRGNSRRVHRVEREAADERARAYAPNPLRMFGPFGRW